MLGGRFVPLCAVAVAIGSVVATAVCAQESSPDFADDNPYLSLGIGGDTTPIVVEPSNPANGESGPVLRGSSNADQAPLDLRGEEPKIEIEIIEVQGVRVSAATWRPPVYREEELAPLEGYGIGDLIEDAEHRRREAGEGGGIAVFRGLDKITARITVVEAPINEPVMFGRLEITARYCYKRPPEETPEVTAFLEVRDLTKITGTTAALAPVVEVPGPASEPQVLPELEVMTGPDAPQETDILAEPVEEPIVLPQGVVFSGWMFASSPAVNAMEHPVYDVWLVDCRAVVPLTEFGSLPKDPAPKQLELKRTK